MKGLGTLRAMQACCNRDFGSDNSEHKRAAVQGLGAVGHNVVEQLHVEGAADGGHGYRPRQGGGDGPRIWVEQVEPEAIYYVDRDISVPVPWAKSSTTKP